MDKAKGGRIKGGRWGWVGWEVGMGGVGGGDGWGGGPWWGENGDNYTLTTIF